MEHFGILLQSLNKTAISPDLGEIQFVADTDELATAVNGEIQYRPNRLDDSRYAISNGTTLPLDGLEGDWFIDTDSFLDGEFIEYFKFSNWVERPQGYEENYLTNNFEAKIDWSLFITRDGSVKLDQTAYDAKFSNSIDNLTPSSLVVKKLVDARILEIESGIDAINIDGTDNMLPQYSPTLDGDVLDIKSLASGNIFFVPPIVNPMLIGAIWNNAGVLSVVQSGEKLGQVETPLSSYSLNGTQFGRAVALSSTRMLVGSQVYYNSDMGGYTGAAWLLDRETGDLITRLDPNTNQNWQQMGWSVDLSEDRVVVGSDYGYNSEGNQTGVVYVYDNDGVLIKELFPHDFTGLINFGLEVKVFGDNILVGTSNTSDGNKVYVYDKNGIFKFIINHPETIGHIGHFSNGIGVSSVIVIGDPTYSLNDDINETGKAWIYNMAGGLITAINPPVVQEVSTWGAFGLRVEVSSTKIFISHPTYDYGNGDTDRKGRVYVFDHSGVLLDTINCPLAGGSEFGMSLDISEDGSRLAIGDWNGWSNGAKTGVFWIYDVATKQLEKYFEDDWAYGNAWGSDVAINDGLLLCGSYDLDSVLKYLV